ncbi:MAG: aromatic amino acid ammonia-lyase [Myxococcota bacterium]|nr:aromatic amino acid ammonia-lyase [Myxococcota bacterium]
MTVYLTGNNLQIQDVIAIARNYQPVSLDSQAKKTMLSSYRWVQEASRQEKAIYGINTGFGSLARIRIPSSQSALLSWNLIRSHAAGIGPVAPEDIARATMLLRANALAKGVSGCRPILVEKLLRFLNQKLTPVIPMKGSCGSSGDLAPLAHLGLVLIGDPMGEAFLGGVRMPAPEALQKTGIPRLTLQAKDGLAITNGAQLSTAIACLSCFDAEQLIKAAELAAAMSTEALLGVSRAFHPSVHQLRPYPGAIRTAHNIRHYFAGSTLIDSVPEKVQDAYSIRCSPQVIGAARDMYDFVKRQVSIELNSATDNPLILLDEPEHNKPFSAGMFHGEPIGMACDTLKIAISEVASISERRLYRLTTGNLSQLLPPGLVGKDRPVLGMIVPQTTAAALVSENKALGWPASLDSIPTCEDQEDHIAMSTVAARRCYDVIQNARRVVAIEILTAAHALEHRIAHRPSSQLGQGTKVAYANMQNILFDLSNHSTMGEQIEAIAQSIHNGLLFEGLE